MPAGPKACMDPQGLMRRRTSSAFHPAFATQSKWRNTLPAVPAVSARASHAATQAGSHADRVTSPAGYLRIEPSNRVTFLSTQLYSKPRRICVSAIASKAGAGRGSGRRAQQPLPKQDNAGVYVIHIAATRLIKFGRSTDIERRMGELGRQYGHDNVRLVALLPLPEQQAQKQRERELYAVKRSTASLLLGREAKGDVAREEMPEECLAGVLLFLQAVASTLGVPLLAKGPLSGSGMPITTRGGVMAAVRAVMTDAQARMVGRDAGSGSRGRGEVSSSTTTRDGVAGQDSLALLEMLEATGDKLGLLHHAYVVHAALGSSAVVFDGGKGSGDGTYWLMLFSHSSEAPLLPPLYINGKAFTRYANVRDLTGLAADPHMLCLDPASGERMSLREATGRDGVAGYFRGVRRAEQCLQRVGLGGLGLMDWLELLAQD